MKKGVEKEEAKKDIRPKLIWLSGVIAIVLTLFMILFYLYLREVNEWNTRQRVFIAILESLPRTLIIFWLPIVIGVVLSLWLSGVKSKLKNYFVYLVLPIFVILSFVYFTYDYHTCSEKFCELNSIFWGFSEILFISFFAVFYIIGTYARQKSAKFIIWVIVIEVIVLILFAIFYEKILYLVTFLIERFYRLFGFFFKYPRRESLIPKITKLRSM